MNHPHVPCLSYKLSLCTAETRTDRSHIIILILERRFPSRVWSKLFSRKKENGNKGNTCTLARGPLNKNKKENQSHCGSILAFCSLFLRARFQMRELNQKAEL